MKSILIIMSLCIICLTGCKNNVESSNMDNPSILTNETVETSAQQNYDNFVEGPEKPLNIYFSILENKKYEDLFYLFPDDQVHGLVNGYMNTYDLATEELAKEALLLDWKNSLIQREKSAKNLYGADHIETNEINRFENYKGDIESTFSISGYYLGLDTKKISDVKIAYIISTDTGSAHESQSEVNYYVFQYDGKWYLDIKWTSLYY